MTRDLRIAISFLVTAVLVVGLVPPAGAALPLKTLICGQTVKRSFRLDNDLNCNGDGIVVGKKGITIDLNGHIVAGDGDVNDFGIDNTSGRDDVTIKNGTVQNFDDGVRIGRDTLPGTPTDNIVKNVIATSNAFDGIDLDEGRGHRVIGSTASNNGDQGMDIDANATVVRASTASNNGDSGIEISGRGNVVKGSTASDNGDEGIHLASADRSLVVGSTTSNNGQDGIDIEGNRNVVKNSTSTLNTSNGVDIDGNENKVIGSDVSTNDANGIFVVGAETKVNDSTLNDNGLPGANDDQGLGFDGQLGEASSGTENQAAGNDDPAQCIPDICLP